MPVLLRLPAAWHITQVAWVTCSIYQENLLLLLLHGVCYSNIVSNVLDLYACLGLHFKDSKSVLVLSVVVCHLGFDIDALNHHITLPEDKCLSIASHCCQLLSWDCT